MKIDRILIIYLLFLISIIPSQAQSSEDNTSFDNPGFSIDHPFEISLLFDIKSFMKNRDEEEYVDATITYYLPDSSYYEKKVRIRARGKTRKSKCYMPPIKIDFIDSDYGVEAFNNMGKIKMVSNCKQAGNFEQYLIKEYLVYKAYECISEYSLKTYLLKVNFIDSEDRKKPFTNYSFIIEDIDDMAERNNGIEVENSGLMAVHLDRSVMNLMGMFQFMIGNTDWHVSNLHNLKLIKINDVDRPRPVPVPYDFDYAGIVNANYAVPHETIPIENVTERYYMGNCMTQEEFQTVQKIFLDNKEEIIKLFSSCDILKKYNQNTTAGYLDDFYTIISNENLVDRWIFSNCD